MLNASCLYCTGISCESNSSANSRAHRTCLYSARQDGGKPYRHMSQRDSTQMKQQPATGHDSHLHLPFIQCNIIVLGLQELMLSSPNFHTRFFCHHYTTRAAHPNLSRDQYRVPLGMRHCATSRKVSGSSPEEVDISIDLILPAALWPWGRLSLYQK
jgi:hypothetical protein